MASILGSAIFRLKLVQVILSLGSIIPIFSEIPFTFSLFTSDFVNLTVYSYLGISIIVLASLCIAEPVSDHVIRYSSGLAVILHLISAIFVIKDVFVSDTLWGLRIISGLCTGANALAYGWEMLYALNFLHV